MKHSPLTHPDWTDKQCLHCGTTLTKQEIAVGQCLVCKTPCKPLDRWAARLAHISYRIAVIAIIPMGAMLTWLFCKWLTLT